MSDGNLDSVDLFGDPTRLPSGRRGRPAHRYSQKIANKIMLLQAVGRSQEYIADACHISVPTLKKHYSSVLKHKAIQRARLEGWKLEKLFDQADSGNVGAMKELQRAIDRIDQEHAAARLRGSEDGEKGEKLGKKEEARRAAQKASVEPDSGWGGLLKGGYDA